ncbi:MAG TPA: glycosyltransferase 61 family protein [Sandaracinaceae bacterium]
MSAADEVVEVCPAEEAEVPEAFSLPGQLERARGSCAESTLEYEISHLLQRRMWHAPTLAMRFDDALLIDGVVYANGARQQHVWGYERLWPRWIGGFPEVEDVSLPSSVVGNRYFGHFITDDCCAAYLASEFAPVRFTSTGAPRSPHTLRYLEIFGLPTAEIGNARLRNVWLFSDYAMSASKRERYRRLRAKVARLPGSRSGHGVFFRRRGAGVPRGLTNEPELEERLEREGFEIIDVTVDDADTIIRRTKDAAIVCGIEGSAPMHGMLAMAEGGALVMLMPPYRFSSCMKGHADAVGIQFGYLIGEGGRESFSISVDELMRTIDLAWSRVTCRAPPAPAAVGGAASEE